MRRAKWGIRKRGRYAALPWQVVRAGTVYASFATFEQARRYVAAHIARDYSDLIALLAGIVRAS